MATTVKKNFFATGVRPMPEPMGSELVSVRCAAFVTGAIVSGDVIKLAKLPAGCVLVDYIYDNTDLDANATPTLAADLGILVAAGDAISDVAADGKKWITAGTALRAAAVTRATLTSDLLHMEPSGADRVIAMVATANAATGHSGDGEIGITLFYRAAYQGN